MPEGKGTYGNKRGRPPTKDPRKNYIPTGELETKLKEINKAPENTLNKNKQLNFILKKDKKGKWYKHYEDGTRGNIKHSVGEQIAKDKAQGKPNTSHYTVEHVRMKDVKDPKKSLSGDRREKVVERLQKKTTRTPKTDANTPKKTTKTKGLKGKGKAGAVLALASLLGLSMSADKSKKKEETPKRTKRPNRVPPSKSEGSKNIKQQMDSEEAIKARMQADRNQPVDFKGDYPVYRKDSAPAQSFRETYNREKKAGKKTFTWQGRKYTTK